MFRRRLPDHRRCAARDRVIDISPAIRSLHRIRQIRIAWLDRPAIRMQIGRAGHMLAEPCQRMLNGARRYSIFRRTARLRGMRGIHGATPGVRCALTTSFWRADGMGLSGAILTARKVSPAIRAKPGAATRLPKCWPARGSSMEIATIMRGADIGAMPTKEARYLDWRNRGPDICSPWLFCRPRDSLEFAPTARCPPDSPLLQACYGLVARCAGK